MISFGAKFISDATIKRYYNGQGFKDYKASFIEINPKSQNDMISLGKIAKLWKGGNTFATDIYLSAQDVLWSSEPREPAIKNNFYAITQQFSNFFKLDSLGILGLLHLRTVFNNQSQILMFQVDPKNNMHAAFPEFKRVGTAMLDSIKDLFPKHNLIVHPVNSARGFYMSNGFEDIPYSLAMKYCCNESANKTFVEHQTDLDKFL